jgi:hypothetical protein
MSARSRSHPWFRTTNVPAATLIRVEPPLNEGLAHDLPSHCDDPECCVATVIARCRRCGFIVARGGTCPATTHFSGVEFVGRIPERPVFKEGVFKRSPFKISFRFVPLFSEDVGE